MLGGELELSFGAIGEWLHVEVAGTVEPFLVLLGGQRAEEAQAARVIGDSSGARKPAASSPQGSGGGRWQITAIPELLRALDLAGCIVTIDAMGCQKEIARENCAAKG